MSARKRPVRPKSAAGGGSTGNGGASRGSAGKGAGSGGSASRGGAGGGSASRGGAEKRSRAGAATTSPPARRPATPPPGSALAQPVTLGRVLAYLAALVLGALVGLAGSLVQGAWSPGGMLLALAAVGALCYGAGVATGGRGAGFAAGGGWFLAVIAMSLNRPEGDFVFVSGLGPQLFIFGGMVIAVMCTTLPRLVATGEPPSRLPE
ncbi:DUF6113 family protein [Streptomyces sp. 184]|uniref:DUF6113 family protein n=1 Tax=Streptomyces sp. 184 TaxID=1827526 RepID=UPI0038923B46